ncbi:MAG: FKBP-type peptidyl-prolyl cis-trans isomerase [Rikenellaceae bacterium]|nr:FKBP-type peptidyl-prolyl cis-trans isomerase [Rikenellaceae bacterium]
MKKIFNVLAVVVCAAVMVSCGSKVNEFGVSKGDKSKMDTLSYSYGVNFTNDMSQNVPEMKFDWNVLAESLEESMLSEVEYEADETNKAHLTVLEEFFTTKRPERIKKYMEEKNPVDSASSAMAFQQRSILAQMDIFESEEERKSVSEAYGYDLGARFRSARLPIQAYWFAQAIKEFSAGESKMASDEASNFLDTYFLNVMPRKNKEASEAWLAKMEKKSGVQKTESGLLYRIDREGDAAVKPTAQDVVKVNYEGKLRDGFVFDSSYERGEPVEFPLTGVIQGWTEGLQLVGQGGQITLWIPSDLAYGQGGAAGGMIGPNEALEFKVELLEVKSQPAPATPAEEVTEQKAE